MRAAILFILLLSALLFLPPPKALERLVSAGSVSSLPCKSVLFIGNSLTFVSNIPERVQDLSERISNGPPLCVTSRAVPAVTLEWHWNDATTREMLAEKQWDYVVLQEQSGRSYQEFGKSKVSVMLFTNAIRARKGKPILYAILSMLETEQSRRAYAKNIENLSQSLALRVVPVNRLWEDILRGSPSAQILLPDHHHPAPFGAYSAALMFVRCLSGTLRPTQADTEVEPAAHIFELVVPRKARANFSSTEVQSAFDAVERSSPIC